MAKVVACLTVEKKVFFFQQIRIHICVSSGYTELWLPKIPVFEYVLRRNFERSS
jgi:hypothetical protein